MTTYTGGCHCGSVRFEVNIEEPLRAHECNCSMCNKVGFLHLIVPNSQFKVIQGEDVLTEYSFNTGVAKHWFCMRCGVKSFYLPRSNPDGISVNMRCLDDVDWRNQEVLPFDGENWEQNAAALADLSKEK